MTTKLDYQRLRELLIELRQRKPSELTVGVLGLGASFTPEMWHALDLLRKERRGPVDDRGGLQQEKQPDCDHHSGHHA